MGGRGSGGGRSSGGSRSAAKEEAKPKTSTYSTATELRSELIRGVTTSGQIGRDDFRLEEYDDGSIDLSVRRLGIWTSPPGKEDYDWERLSDKSYDQVDSIVNSVQKSTGRKIDWSPSEKNWLDFRIK